MGESRIRDMRLIVTADLHYNHAHSQAQTQDMIEQINRVGGDVLMLVGDTCVPEGDGLERCLSRILFKGPKLFVAGNHELWTSGQDSYAIFKEELRGGWGRWAGGGWKTSPSWRTRQRSWGQLDGTIILLRRRA